MHRVIGERLEQFCRDASGELFIASAYIKADALGRLIEVLSTDAELICVVRWRPEDLASGASDLEVYDLLSRRPHSSLRMCRTMHAKYFRSHNGVLLGSANLTNSGLGWSSDPNLELLAHMPLGEATADFEQELLRRSVEVTESVVAKLARMLEAMKLASAVAPEFLEPLGGRAQTWLPLLRDPEMLFAAYSGDLDSLPTNSQRAALQDLHYLAVPVGLTREAFVLFVSAALAQAVCVAQLRLYLSQPRRFGEVAAWLGAEFGVEQGKHVWQTLMRWLLKFLPDEFRVTVYNYSEVVSLV